MLTYASCCGSPLDSYSPWVPCSSRGTYTASAAARAIIYTNCFVPKERGIPQTPGLAYGTSSPLNYSTEHLENFFSPKISFCT